MQFDQRQKNIHSIQNNCKQKTESIPLDEPSSNKESAPEMEEYHIFKIEAASSLMRKSINDSHCDESSWLLSTIRQILATPVPKLEMHEFVFEISKDAAVWNAEIIKENDCNYEKTVESMPNSALSPGSEFRSSKVLANLLKYRED